MRLHRVFPAWHRQLQRYRLCSDPVKIGYGRLLLYVALGYAAAGPIAIPLLLANAVAVIGALAVAGFLNNYWDARLLGERNALFSAKPAMASPGIRVWQPLWLWLPLLALTVRQAVSWLPLGLLALALGAAIAYSAPPIRLKRRPVLGFIISPIAAGLLFAQASACGRPPLHWWLPLSVLVVIFQAYAELLQYAGDEGQKTVWVNRLPLIGAGCALALLRWQPLCVFSIGANLCRWSAVRRMAPQDIRQARRRLGSPIFSLIDFAVYGAAALLGWFPVNAYADDAAVRMKAEQAVTHALTFLEQAQLPSGEFPSYRWKEDGSWPSEYFGSPFVTAHAAYALRHLQSQRAQAMVGRAAEFLSGDRGTDGFWKFFSRDNSGYHRMPADVEDTAVSAGVLMLAGRPPQPLPDLLRYRDRQGRFVTWIFPAVVPTAQDIAAYSGMPLGYERRVPNELDCVVNANILFYYGLQGRVPAESCAYVNAAVLEGRYPACALYYRGLPVMAYMLTRAHEQGAVCLEPSLRHVRDSLRLMQQPDGGWGGSLDTAFALAALLSSDASMENWIHTVDGLLAKQAADGGWPQEVFFIDNLPPGLVYGSRAATTAIVLESLNRYLKRSAG